MLGYALYSDVYGTYVETFTNWDRRILEFWNSWNAHLDLALIYIYNCRVNDSGPRKTSDQNLQLFAMVAVRSKYSLDNSVGSL